MTQISIRFSHPTRDLSFLTSLLDLTCFRNWTVGTPKQTITGRPLPGYFKESYWTSLTEFSAKSGFSTLIKDTSTLLKKHQGLIRELKSSGGTVEIYLTLPGSFNNGDTIEATDLKAIGSLGVNLSIEVFPKIE